MRSLPRRMTTAYIQGAAYMKKDIYFLLLELHIYIVLSI